MNLYVLKRALLLILLLGIGFIGGTEYSSKLNRGNNALLQDRNTLSQIIRLGSQEMGNKECYSEKEKNQPYYVSDFLINYIDFFSKPNSNKASHYNSCGLRKENLCGLTYFENNVEGDKGVSWTLWYEVDSITQKIIPSSFECWGL